MPELETTFRLPDDCPDRKTLKRLVHDALTGDLSFHRRLKCALTNAGFKVSTVQKHWFHDCWEIRLTRSAAMLEDSPVQVRRRIRRVLKAEGIYSKYDGIEVGVQGRRLVLGFISKLGAVGFI